MKQQHPGLYLNQRYLYWTVTLCVLGVMVGCSSRLNTATWSGSGPAPTQTAQVESVNLPEEEIITQPILDEGTLGGSAQANMDIPVEPPALPAISSPTVSESLPSPQVDTGLSEPPKLAESAGVADHSLAQAPASGDTSLVASEKIDQGIPSIQVDPEPPAVATLRMAESSSGEPKALSPEASTPDAQVQEPIRQDAPPGPSDGSSHVGPESMSEDFQPGAEVSKEIGVVPQTLAASDYALAKTPMGDPGHSAEPAKTALDQLRADIESAIPSGESVIEAQSATPSIEAPTTPSKEAPMQVAKVLPSEPESVQIMEEELAQALQDIYFDYDRFTIRGDAESVLRANATLLVEKWKDKRIIIEGHCDERGTQSYNMVLGERRANAVKTFLEDLGVPAQQLEVVSYGKDRPFCTESGPECWQENRRGHFVVQ